jgi:dihydroorotase
MSAHYDLIVRGGACVLPWGIEHVSIGVRHGRIAALGVGVDAEAEETLDARGLHVLPGLIDPHVHLRDPGDATVESTGTGTRAAILGGITGVFDMPNTSPPLTDEAALARRRRKVEREAWCDVGLYVGATVDNLGALATLEREHGVCAVKVFVGSSTGTLLIADDATLERVMLCGHRRVAYHAEDEYRLRERRALFATGEPYARHAEWRDPEVAFSATRRVVALAWRTGRPAHLLHLSTAEEFAYVRDFRALVSCEVVASHLTLVAPECYERLGGYAVMNPPIRTEEHRQAAWAAVRDGTVDCIGSDHAPHPRAAKEKPWPECRSGLTGVQTLVPLMLDHVNAGRLSLQRLVDLMCAGPARVYGLLGKGRLAVGFDADFTLVDLRRRRRIEAGWIASPCGWSPYEGMEVTGWPAATVLRGRVVMRDDAVLGAPSGQLLRFAG